MPGLKRKNMVAYNSLHGSAQLAAKQGSSLLMLYQMLCYATHVCSHRVASVCGCTIQRFALPSALACG